MTESWEPQLPPAEPRPDRADGFPLGLTIATAIAVAILIGLGVWQLQRLKWKEGLLAHIAALQAQKARPLAPVLDELGRGRDAAFTRVSVSCPGLAHAPFLQLYGLYGGQAGWRLISACRLTRMRYGSILVDRGFIADSATGRPRVDLADQTPLRLTGVLRTPDRATFVTPANNPVADRWFSRNIGQMAGALKAPDPAPIFLMAETATNPELPALVPAPLPPDIPNRHLEYALTWFGLAAAAAGVYVAMLFKRRKV